MGANFIISGFSDEIDEQVTKQFAHLNKLGIAYFEPRGIDGANIADLDDGQVLELKQKKEQYGIKASSIGSPIGKIKITDDFEAHLKKLKRVIRTAKLLGTKYIRVFSFFMPQDADYAPYKAEVLRRMKAMTALAEAEGMILLHENEKEIYGDTAPRCLEIIEAVNSPALRCVFDPANFIQCGQDTYPAAFELLKPYIVYMHIKDALPDGEVVPAGYGAGNLEAILRALNDNGYNGFLSLEPHLGSFTGLANLENSDEMLKLTKSTPEKFTLAYESLKTILERMN